MRIEAGGWSKNLRYSMECVMAEILDDATYRKLKVEIKEKLNVNIPGVNELSD